MLALTACSVKTPNNQYDLAVGTSNRLGYTDTAVLLVPYRVDSLHLADLLVQTSRFPLLDAYIQRLRVGFGFSPAAIIELALIGIVVYWTLKFLQGTRGARLLRAVLLILTVLLVVAIMAQLLQLERIIFLYPYFVGAIFLIALVAFQTELRRGLMAIGETFATRTLSTETAPIIDPLVKAAANLSRQRVGGLVAIECGVPLGGLAESGVQINADTTRELIETIFWPGSALHDLGVIISHGRIVAAGCEFPLGESDEASRIIGSRHRAALGMSLESDAFVLVISEETGSISVARRGRLRGPLKPEQLRELLVKELLDEKGKKILEATTAEEPQQNTDAESKQTKTAQKKGGKD